MIIDAIVGVLLFASIAMLVYAQSRRMQLTLYRLRTPQRGFAQWVKDLRIGKPRDQQELLLYREGRRWMIRGYVLAAIVVVAAFVWAWVAPRLG